MARILLTGATGFIGSHMLGVLNGRGHEVVAATRRAGPALRGPCRVAVIGDDWESADWAGALEGVDFVVNCAGLAHQSGHARDDAGIQWNINSTGVGSLARASVGAGVRKIIHLSTVKVLGEFNDEGPWTRNSPCRPAGAYAQSKYRGEQLLREIAGGSTLRYSIIRPPLVFGPGVGANFLALLRWIDRHAPLPLGSVNNRRSILGVANLCDLVMNLLERHADTSQDPLLVSDGQDYSTPDLIRLVAAALNRPALLLPVPPRALRLATRALGRGAAFDRLCGSLAVDCRESCDPLGWRPPTSTVDQLRSTVAWYRACGSCRNH